MTLKEIIQDYKRRTGISNNELAATFKVTPNTISRWLHGDVKSLQDDTAQRMSKIIGFDVQSVLQGNIAILKRPILGFVKAGYNLFLEENYLGEEAVTIDEFKQGDFFLKVTGDSMKDAGIIDGGLVFVESCNEVDNGQIAVVAYDDEVTIKKFYKNETGITLVACNNDYSDRFFSIEDIEKTKLQVLGKVLFSKNYF